MRWGSPPRAACVPHPLALGWRVLLHLLAFLRPPEWGHWWLRAIKRGVPGPGCQEAGGQGARVGEVFLRGYPFPILGLGVDAEQGAATAEDPRLPFCAPSDSSSICACYSWMAFSGCSPSTLW